MDDDLGVPWVVFPDLDARAFVDRQLYRSWIVQRTMIRDVANGVAGEQDGWLEQEFRRCGGCAVTIFPSPALSSGGRVSG